MGGESRTASKAALLGVVAAIALAGLAILTSMPKLDYYLSYLIPVGVGFLAVSWKKTPDFLTNVIEGAIAGLIYGILRAVILNALILIIDSGVPPWGIKVFLLFLLIATALAAVGGALASIVGKSES